jgi:tripartite-type tricarboxylate transporter receptor subunit TctC
MKTWLRILVALAALLVEGQSLAQAFPSRTVALVVPNPPGGAIDIVGRILAQKLQELWGQNVILDYKAGAGTILGMEYIAKSPPDGHTFGIAVTPLVIVPALRRDMPYDTLKDLSGVTLLGTSSIMIAAAPTLQANTLAEVIALAKKNPGKLTYASPGSGSSMHLTGELIKLEAGIDMLHVPFKGGAQAYPELMAGRIDLQLDPTFSIIRYVKAGKMKAIAVTSAKRDPAAPEVPTVSETLRGITVQSIYGAVVSGRTPRELVNKLSVDIRKVLELPEVAKRFTEIGLEPAGTSPEAFDAYIRSELARWSKVAKAANVKLD